MTILNDQIVALESIGYQLDKGTVKQFISLLSMPYFYLSKLDNEYKNEGPKSSIFKYKKFKEYCKQLFNTELKKLIKTHFNIELYEAVVEGVDDSHTGMAMSMVSEKSSNTKKMFEYLNKIVSQDLSESDISKIDKLKNLLGDVDIKAGKMINNKKNLFKFKLFFNLPMTYLADRVLVFTKTKREKASLTPEEITAVLFHEIGHYITITEMLISGIYTGLYANHLLNASMKSAKRQVISRKSNEEIVNDGWKELAKKKKIILTLINRESKISNKDLDQYDEALNDLSDKIETIVNKIKINKKDIEKASLNQRLLIVFLNLLFSFYLIVILMKRSIINVTLNMLNIAINQRISINMVEYYKRNNSNLSREIFSSERSFSSTERLADEFVSRMGMEKYLISGLSKLNTNLTVYNPLGGNGYFSTGIDPINSGILSYIIKTLYIFNTLIVSCIEPFSKTTNSKFTRYEDIIKRYKRAAENRLAIFKDSNLSKKEKIRLTKEYEEIIIALNEAIKTERFNVFNLIPNFIQAFNSILDYSLDIVFDKALFGFTNKDAIKMLDAFDSLLSNEVYYYSAKLDTLFS